jgi:hypothetical protein
VLTARMTLSECVRAALAAALLLGLAACATPGDRAASPASPAMNVLAGLDSAQVRALLGTPDFRRNDPPAELWQYRSADCVLDLYFYGEAGAQTLAFAQMRNRDLQQAAADSCADRALPPRSDKRQTKL